MIFGKFPLSYQNKPPISQTLKNCLFQIWLFLLVCGTEGKTNGAGQVQQVADRTLGLNAREDQHLLDPQDTAGDFRFEK